MRERERERACMNFKEGGEAIEIYICICGSEKKPFHPLFFHCWELFKPIYIYSKLRAWPWIHFIPAIIGEIFKKINLQTAILVESFLMLTKTKRAILVESFLMLKKKPKEGNEISLYNDKSPLFYMCWYILQKAKPINSKLKI